MQVKSTAAFLAALTTATVIGSAVAGASCGDRPGTPDNPRAEAMSSTSIVFRWRNTTRWVERICFDIEVRDRAGNAVGQDIVGGLCRGGGYHQPMSHTFRGLRTDVEFCFRIRARTEPGTQGCVSQIFSAPVCARTNPALHHGSDTCKPGFVWREATPNDHVCVPVETRTETKRDNALAAQRREPRGGAFGPDTCKSGFVWREAVPGDHVCVPPETRTKARQDNALAAQRRVRS